MMIIATTERFNLSNGGLEIRFNNKVTGESTTRRYKTESAGKAAETKFHNRMNRLYGHLLMDPSVARQIASDIDRLANLVDPYEYYDVVGRDPEDWNAHVDSITRDLLSGNTQPYIDWLRGVAEDDSNDARDRERARSRMRRIQAYCC